MCLYPRLIKNKKYTANKKNGGNVPPVKDDRTKYVPVGCQNCIECTKQKARAWQVRLLEDIKDHKNGKFVTFTFSNESIAELAAELKTEGYLLDNQIATLATRRFLERWRKTYKKSLRHWLITELGHNGTENIHLHGIIWTDEHLDKVECHWKYGFMWKYKTVRGIKVNYVNEATINYITKYVTKKDELHKTYKPIILTSPGIGKRYTENGEWQKNKYKGKETNELYRNRQGYKMNMPIYWRNKIYSDQEREELWLNRLDKHERWVTGVKIDISNGDEHYWNVLEQARSKNRQLGYGTDVKDWNREVYERETRIIKQRARITSVTASPRRRGSNQKDLDIISEV